MGKLIKSRVLRDRAGLRRAPKGGDGVRKFPPSCRAERVWGKTKLCEAGATTHPLAPPHPIAIPYLYQIHINNK